MGSSNDSHEHHFSGYVFFRKRPFVALVCTCKRCHPPPPLLVKSPSIVPVIAIIFFSGVHKYHVFGHGKGWRRLVDSLKRFFADLDSWPERGGGAATAGPPRRAHVAGGHQTFSGRRQVHTPARVRSGGAGRARARPQKIAQHARAAFTVRGHEGLGESLGPSFTSGLSLAIAFGE